MLLKPTTDVITMAQARCEVHETATELINEAAVRGGPAILKMPRPIGRIAKVLGSQVHRAPNDLLRGNKGLCTETAILIGSTDPAWVERFTIAHELGHQWLGRTAEEWECNAFAGSILIPSEDVHNELARHHLAAAPLDRWAECERHAGILTRLVRRYWVGYDAMIRALADYGWIVGVDPWTSIAYGDRLFKAYAQYWRQSS